jgi:hypothetical protein
MDGYRQRVAGKDGQRKEGRFWKRLKIKTLLINVILVFTSCLMHSMVAKG